MYERVKQLEAEYLRSDGIGQFSWYRFACSVISNEPAFTEELVAFALETILQSGPTHVGADAKSAPLNSDC